MVNCRVVDLVEDVAEVHAVVVRVVYWAVFSFCHALQPLLHVSSRSQGLLEAIVIYWLLLDSLLLWLLLALRLARSLVLRVHQHSLAKEVILLCHQLNLLAEGDIGEVHCLVLLVWLLCVCTLVDGVLL